MPSTRMPSAAQSFDADPRATEPPVGMADLATPDRLEERLGEAHFVILTTPETPDTVGMFQHQDVHADDKRCPLVRTSTDRPRHAFCGNQRRNGASRVRNSANSS